MEARVEIPVYLVAVVSVLLVTINVLVFTVMPGMQDAKLVSATLTVFFAFAAAAALVYMRFFLLRLNKEWADRWTWVAAGFVLWLAAEVIWAYYALEGKTQGLTLADSAWLAGYVAIFFGLIGANLGTFAGFKLRDTLYALIFGIVALGVISYALVPALSAPVGLFEKAVKIFYPLADIAIVFLSLRLASAFLDSPLRVAWGVLLLGLTLLAVSDAWITSLELSGQYLAGHPSEFLYNSSYILVGMGALLFESMSRSGFRRPADSRTAVEWASGILDKFLLKKKSEQAVSITTTRSFVDVGIAAIKLLMKNKGTGCVLVCLDRTHAHLVEQMENAGIYPERVHLVVMGAGGEKEEGFTTLDGLGDLSTIKIRISSALSDVRDRHEKHFIIIDGIPTLTLYNDLNRLGQFLHDLNLDMRRKNVYLVILLAADGEINEYVMRFCDTNISLI